MRLFLFVGMGTGRRTPDSHSHLGIPTAGGAAVFKVTLGVKIQPERGDGGEGTRQPRVMYMCTPRLALPCDAPLSRTSHMVLPRHEGNWEM